ncbi:metallophosphoesterase family protein [Dinghuibacter silviterrae]|uniref:Calcineurin-like phosphoesterase family protein n=1 Tax=Dinghuibacter silviterrae TaxID=1539049 RepID=A0A4R8DHM9_9BACT|nr:metallophosphoesterase [Dinghuibacter silviterrae]TDW96754.1 calcineurin-like phosphoesterase family protein [Dinghuibacter silviterrae]
MSKRDQSDYLHLGRTVIENHFRTERKKSKGAPVLNQITAFIARHFWSWIYYYLDSRFGKPHPYPTYPETGDRGVYPLPGRNGVRLAVCADWGTNTAESRQIADRMRSHEPDYTIHLGDTYYVGEPKEIAANFLDPGSPWYRGPLGSFAVLGNHEMYAKGSAFFENLLPTMGPAAAPGRALLGQRAGYFCLENAHWRLLGLDTGYHSIGKPILELLPRFQPDCRLDDTLVQWLKNVVRVGEDQRGLVLMTHHQYISAFNEPEYTVPARQLAELIGEDRPVIWIWGHEHRFSLYEKFSMKNGLTAYGRCIGHGGMPIEIKTDARKPGNKGYDRLVMVDDRVRPGVGAPKGDPLGWNGYAVLTVNGPELTIEYCDAERSLFSETWTSEMRGTVTVDPHCPLKPVSGKQWQDAVR